MALRCHICGGDAFRASEYRAESVRAPARECMTCHALVLDEEAATSDEERDSVRIAAAARAAHCADAPLHGKLPDEEPVTQAKGGRRVLGPPTAPR
jgi:hypothetical protein